MVDISPLSSVSFLDLAHFFFPKVITATLCGGMVGIERELKHKVVGIKTNVLICVGVTLFTSCSFLLGSLIGVTGGSYDATRFPGTIIGQIITGVGFLGAGAIFKSNDRVLGLTSAAFVWIVSAIGVIIGSGGIAIAIALTIGLVVGVLGLSWAERHWFHKGL